MLMRLLPMAELAGSLHGMRGGHLAQPPLRALERGEQSHIRAVERGVEDAGPGGQANAARTEVEKLASGATIDHGPTGTGSTPTAEPGADDTRVPELQDDGVRVAGFGDITPSEAPLSAEVIRDLSGEGRPQLTLGAVDHPPAVPPPPAAGRSGIGGPEAPPDLPPGSLDPPPPAEGPAVDDANVRPRNIPDLQPPEDS
jgi:hypothetical protein